ncbi:hypothetical protein ACQY1M_25145 (plasmid) [Neorhizobium sp. DAR64861/K0K2]|uniref:hypothetical protein n=1 Tax=Neorhizobium sp. DAR64861/K0K2 TaxID=3421956 RepID=UPI003D2C8DD2
MTEEQIPEFVDAIIATGCPICAIGHEFYVLGEIDVPDQDFDRVVKEVQAISKRYGERDHLRPQIVEHLRSIGRFIELEQPVRH